jgi:hypothetical protein
MKHIKEFNTYYDSIKVGDYIAIDFNHFRSDYKDYITIMKVNSSPMTCGHNYYELECLYKLNNGKLEELKFGDKMRMTYLRIDHVYLVKSLIYSSSDLKDVIEHVYLMDSVNKYNL